MNPSTRLTDGALVRNATRADIDAVAELLADRGEPDDAVDLRLVAATDEGLAGIGVVEVDGRVVATATLLDEHVRIGSVLLPAGQLELVASATSHEHRGYVRALAAWCHARSSARGHLLQLVYGIPYYYRQFGYREAVQLHPWGPLPELPPAPDDVGVRRATASDVEAMSRLQELTQARFDVAMPHQAECWRWLVERSGSTLWVAERDGAVVGACRSARDGDDTVVAEIATTDADATTALLSTWRAVDQVRVSCRPGVPGLDARHPEHPAADWFLARVADPAAVIEALRPELDGRVAATSPGLTADVLLSFYRSHVRFRVDGGTVGPVTAGGPLQGPVSQGGSGIPPDAVGDLLLGGGVDAVERWHRDAMLGAQRDLLRVLFPPRSADLLSFYLPS